MLSEQEFSGTDCQASVLKPLVQGPKWDIKLGEPPTAPALPPSLTCFPSQIPGYEGDPMLESPWRRLSTQRQKAWIWSHLDDLVHVGEPSGTKLHLTPF